MLLATMTVCTAGLGAGLVSDFSSVFALFVASPDLASVVPAAGVAASDDGAAAAGAFVAVEADAGAGWDDAAASWLVEAAGVVVVGAGAGATSGAATEVGDAFTTTGSVGGGGGSGSITVCKVVAISVLAVFVGAITGGGVLSAITGAAPLKLPELEATVPCGALIWMLPPALTEFVALAAMTMLPLVLLMAIALPLRVAFWVMLL